MTDLRARLADELREHQCGWAAERGFHCTSIICEWVGHNLDFEEHQIDALLSLPGIAIVHTDDIKYAFADPHLGYDRHRASINRLLAAAEQDPR